MALIIDADMPTCCKNCDLHETVYGTHLWYRCFVDFHEVTQQVNAGTKSEDCPILGEIPDEHGELMDKKAFFESEKGRTIIIGRAGARAIRELYERIEKAPAVVEAAP